MPNCLAALRTTEGDRCVKKGASMYYVYKVQFYPAGHLLLEQIMHTNSIRRVRFVLGLRCQAAQHIWLLPARRPEVVRTPAGVFLVLPAGDADPDPARIARGWTTAIKRHHSPHEIVSGLPQARLYECVHVPYNGTADIGRVPIARWMDRWRERAREAAAIVYNLWIEPDGSECWDELPVGEGGLR